MNLHKLGLWVGICLPLAAMAGEPVDLATYWETPPTEAQTLAAGDYTLSADTTVPVALLLKQGSTFDFSADQKTFSVYGPLTLAYPYEGETTVFKGGTWVVGDPANKYLNGLNTSYTTLSLDNYRFFIDGATVKARNVMFVPTGSTGSSLFALTNGAALYLDGRTPSSDVGYSEFCRIRTDPSPFLLDISTGSKLSATNELTFAYTGGGDRDIPQKGTFRVRDSGSDLYASTLTIGQYSPGYLLEVSDGASARASTLNIGSGSAAHDNTVIVRGAGSKLTATYPYIGEQKAPTYDTKQKLWTFYGGTSNNWVHILDGASATLSTEYQRDFQIGPYSANNGVYVSNATLTVQAVFLGKKFDGGLDSPGETSAAGSNNVLHVTGGKTKAKMNMTWQNHRGMPYRPFGAGERCAIKVENGAELDIAHGSSTYGTSLCGTNCLVRVAGTDAAEGKIATLKTLKCHLTGRGNRVEVLDGAKWNCDGVLGNSVLNQHGCCNEVVVSNATFATSTLKLGTESTAASNNVFTAMGPDTSLSGLIGSSPYRLFGAGPGCELRFEDGAQYSTSTSIFDFCGTNCLLRVSGTNEVAQKRSYFDCRNFNISGKGNTVEVSDGAWLRCYIAYTYLNGVDGEDNTIVVSNGYFSCYQYYGIFIKGASNRLVLRGDRPRVESTCGSNLYLFNGAKVVFELPLGKTYDANYAPLKFNAIYVTDGTRGDAEGTGALPEFQFPNLEAYRKSIDRTVTLKLGQGSFSSARMKEAVAASGAKLPRGCKLACSGSALTLTVRPYRGAAIVVR